MKNHNHPLSNHFLKKNGVNPPAFKIVKIRTENNYLLSLKTLFIGLLILCQLALIILVHIIATKVYYWYLGFSFFATIACCLSVLSSKKHGLSKAVWILFLLLTFYFGFTIYFLSDERIFFRKSRKKYDKVFKETDKYHEKYRLPNATRVVQKDSEFFYRTGKFNTYTNTDIKYFPTGATFFDDLLENLKKAEKFIFIEYFIIADGVLFDRIYNILKEKIASGVEVRIIYDDMGSHKKLSRKNKSKLIKLGVKLKAYNRLVPYFSVALNYRDHRKIVVIDGKIAYTGGCNLADEYINEKRLFGYWKDNGLRLKGPAVDSFSLIFLRQWQFLTGKSEDYNQYFNHFDTYPNSSTVIPYADGLDFKDHIGKGAYENAISSATEKLYIMTPYFILDDTITTLIENRVKSGVDVRIVLPDIPDKKLVYSVSKADAEELTKSGVKIYYMKHAFVHTKAVLTENSAITGSINMDLRSFYQQFECAIYTDDKCALLDAEKDFSNTLSLSTLITDNNKRLKNPFYRVVAGFMQLFAPFM